MTEPPLTVRVLGVTCLTRGSAVIDVASPRQRAILATLAAFDGQPVPTDTLIDVVWGDALPASPGAALHTHLSRLRDTLDPDAIHTTPRGYALAIDRQRIDAWQFADRVRAATGRPPGDRAGLLAAAVDLWRGPAFADVADRPAVQPIAVQLEQLAAGAREELAQVLLALDRVGDALGCTSALVTDYPLRERANALLMESLCRAGRQGESLARYDEYRRALAAELGLSPSPAMVELERAILHHQLPAPAPGSTSPRPGRRRHSLPPLPVSELVGRGTEREFVVSATATARVVTITGPGGVGKTRLAAHCAHDVVDRYPDGAWWCDLAALVPGASAVDVATVLAAGLGIDDRAGGTVVDRVHAVLSGRVALLVLDNCEHVVAGAAELVDELVRRVPTIDVLCTSREALAIDGEHRFRLEPLAVPIGDEVSDAVLLFLHRVRSVNPRAATDGRSWDAVLAICRSLDGLPLALEFAAARASHVAMVDIASQLDRRFDLLPAAQRRHDPRHASLATTLAWSYDLLEPREREVLDALAMFTGPFTTDDARRLCTPPPDALDGRAVEAAVAALVDKSLVTLEPGHGTARYRLLDTVRAYSRDRLATAGSLPTWRARHCAFAIELAARADDGAHGPAEPEWCRILDSHIGELRAARSALLAAGDLDGLVRLCASLAWYADPRSRAEVHRWAIDAAARVRGELRDHPRLPRLLAMAATAASTRGDLDAAEALAREADGAGGGLAGYGIDMLARIDLFRGRLEAAAEHSRLAVDRYRAAGERHWAVNAATTGVLALAFGGRGDDARRASAELLVAAADVGSVSTLAMCEYCAAETAAASGTARSHLERAIALARQSRADFFEGLAITTLAGIEVRSTAPGAAFGRLRDCIDHWERAGLWRQQWWVTLRMLVEALSASGRHAPAVALVRAFETSPSGSVYGTDVDRLADALDRASRALSPQEFAAAAATGAALDDEAALAYGRRVLDDLLAASR